MNLWRELFVGGSPHTSVSEACLIAGGITEPEFDWFTMSFKSAAHNEEVRRRHSDLGRVSKGDRARLSAIEKAAGAGAIFHRALGHRCVINQGLSPVVNETARRALHC